MALLSLPLIPVRADHASSAFCGSRVVFYVMDESMSLLMNGSGP